MKKIALFIVSLLTITTLHSHAKNLAIDIGNDVFSVEVGSKNFTQDNEFSVAMLHADDLHLYSFKGLVTGVLEQNKNLEVALGGKAYYISFFDQDIQGLALGGELNYKIPMNEKFELHGSVYYAPSPMLTDDLDYLTDLTITASYKVLKNGAIYINYRNIKANQESGSDLKIDNGFNVGLNFLF
ncbi:YfaZ family outer membrane protein [Candidatus Colwellia aromaticivorans]|uniref:YfaZ family outer membrane protein n=1 Tax=Candidatus Colwellia aromaticivorans TaxID=2267621 RepID=UPI000DF38296|nr:YfaZ family outer membrane protein [Candidatus Colwellia aromaticivorans]